MTPAEPTELRRTATVARHHAMPSIAAALDAAADRIEGLEKLVRKAVPHVERAPEMRHSFGTGRSSWLCAASEALREVGR